MRRLSTRHVALAVAGLGLLAGTALAARHVATSQPAVRTVEITATRGGNPLLPKALDVSGLFVELANQQKTAALAPAGFEPVYSKEDWAAYSAQFGADADDLIRKRSSGYLELAGKMVTAAQAAPEKSGLRRLLCLRAAALSFRNAGGWAHAGKALTLYQDAMDINVPSHLGGLWSMADTLSRYATTPKPERIKCSAIAAKANMQLSLQLLDIGQLEAAQALTKKCTYHEGYLRSDAHLKAEIVQVRGLVNSTTTMMDYLQEQYTAVIRRGDEAAAMRLYLYARFVRPTPEIVRELDARQSAAAIQNLSAILTAADRDPVMAYTAAETLRNTGTDLPEGIIRQRTLYASLRYYRAFIRSPQTENERVKRTLAQMAIQAVAGDGARGAPTIKPFEVPAATQPTVPATVGATLAPRSARPGRAAPTPPVAPPTILPPVHAVPVDGTPEHPVG